MKKILIIEDEKILVEMYEDKFKKAGFEVYSAMDTKEGLKLTKEEKPDLIVLDILLSQDSGIFFLQKLKKEKDFFSTPVIVFSNYDSKEVRNQALKLGAKDYLIKTNYTPQELIEKIKAYLE